MNDNELPRTEFWAKAFAGEDRESLMAALGVLAGLVADPLIFRRIALSLEPRKRNQAAETQRVIIESAAIHDVTLEEMFGDCRCRRITRARQAAYAAVHEQRPHLSLTQLGKIFGRDHTTILHGIKVHRERMAAQ